MSAWFKDSGAPLLMQESVKVAFDFLDRTGEIDDMDEACHFLSTRSRS